MLYVDRFLSEVCSKNIERFQLQLVGVTSLHIAAKYEEINPPHIEKFVYITDYLYSCDEILTMELHLLEVLKFKIIQPTPLTFLCRILMGTVFSTTLDQALNGCLCAYLCELGVCDYEITTTFPPSIIASSATILSNFILKHYPCWNMELQALSGGYKALDLQNCCTKLFSLLKHLTEKMSNPQDSEHRDVIKYNASSIYTKYCDIRFFSIALQNSVEQSIRAFSYLPQSIFS
jgi:cyclin A